MTPLFVIKAGKLSVWKDFQIKLETDIEFYTAETYHLKGSNGSGKSSIIKNIILPLLTKSHIPFIYVDQSFKLQHYAIRAVAAFAQYPVMVSDEASAICYLLSSLKKRVGSNQGDCVIVLDESPYLSIVQEFIQNNMLTPCLIIVSHDELSIPVTKHLNTLSNGLGESCLILS